MEKQSIFLNTALIPIASCISALGLDLTKLYILSFLMFLDLFSGMVKAHRNNVAITSRRLSAGVLSKLMVLLVPLTVALIAKGIEIDLRWLVSFSVSLLIVAEGYSVIGNIYSVRTGEAVTEIDAISVILKKLRKIIENLLSEK